MNPQPDSAEELIERLKRKAPEYLDLLTAQTEVEFEDAFAAILEKAVVHLEKNKKNFADLNEEGLSGVLAGSISVPGLTVTQETNSNGHVDLTIVSDHSSPIRTKLGEAKIYSGPAYHIKGISQLLGRYTTGRETQGLLLNYVKKSGIKAITTRLRKELDKQLPEKQTGPCVDHSLKWSIISNHAHSSGEEIGIQHVGCNLY